MEVIEKNREESIHQWASEVTDLATDVTAWVKEGDLRSKLAGTVLQIRVRMLEIVLKISETEFGKDVENHPHLKHQVEAVSSLRFRIQLLSYWVERKLAMFQRPEEEEGVVTVDEELQSSAAMEHPEEAWPGDFTDDEGDGSKESSPIDFTHSKQNEEGHSSAAMGFSIAKSLGEAGSKVEDEIDLADKATGMAVIDDAVLGLRVNREDLAREFEKKMRIAARDVQSTDVVWILGLTGEQKFQPVFYLVMGMDKLGSEPKREQHGPPPWARRTEDETDAKQRNGASKGSAMADNKGLGKNLEVTKVEDKEKRAARANLLKPGLIWERQTEPGHFWNDRILVYDLGPNIEILGPPPWPTTLINNFGPISQINTGQGKQKRKVSSLLLPPELLASQTPRGPTRSFEPPPPPPDKPPPQPPDFTSNFSKLSSIPISSAFHSTSYSTQISGKVDAAGEDPGDSCFNQSLESLAFALNLKNSLEDKACLKMSARAVGNHVVVCSFAVPIPPEPPPQPPSDQVLARFVLIHANSTDCTLLQLSGQEDTASIDPGDILILPRLMFEFWLALDCSLENKAYSIGAVMSVDVELKLEGEDSKLADIGCTIQEDGHEDNLMLQLVYHCPRPPDFANRERGLLDDSKMYSCLSKENCLQVQLLHLISPKSWKLRLSFRILVFAKKIEIELWASSHNIDALADVSIESLSLSMQGLITKDNKTDVKTWMCTMEFHGHSSYYNLEDKVV